MHRRNNRIFPTRFCEISALTHDAAIGAREESTIYTNVARGFDDCKLRSLPLSLVRKPCRALYLLQQSTIFSPAALFNFQAAPGAGPEYKLPLPYPELIAVTLQ